MRRVKSTPVNQQINKSTTLNLMQKFPNIADLRKNYALRSFSEADAHTSPFEQFQFWFQEAIEAQMTEPNAMTLACQHRGGAFCPNCAAERHGGRWFYFLYQL